MESLPGEVLSQILSLVTRTSDRNAIAASCKRFYDVDRLQRRSLRSGSGLDPVDEALVRLCKRFSNLVVVELSYLGWMSSQGKQLDDQGLALLAESCPFLASLKLCYCCFVTDTGLGNLGRCVNLETLTLNFMPRISGIGLLSLVTCCGKIKELEVDRCLHVHRVEWLEHLGIQGKLESLSIRNCKGLGELSLASLGCGWTGLRKLVFEVDGSNYRFLKEFGNAGVCGIDAAAPGYLQVLVLSNCVVAPRRGLSSVLSGCGSALLELELNFCLGLRDEQVISLAEACPLLKSLALRLSSLFDGAARISDASLYALAANCVSLEKACIGFGRGDFPLVTPEGLAFFIQGCFQLRELALENAVCFDDQGLEAVCASPSLESLEVVKCGRVGDGGISGLARSNVRKLKVCGCSGVTGAGFGALANRSPKLEVVEVNNCIHVMKECLEGVARNVYYNRD